MDCCNDVLPTPSLAPECSAHAACSGLTGECCPTQVRIDTIDSLLLGVLLLCLSSPIFFIFQKDGQYLYCCDSMEAPQVAACDAYPACQALGLTGLCCATAEGVYVSHRMSLSSHLFVRVGSFFSDAIRFAVFQLECCDGLAEPSAQCSAHSACNGLVGVRMAVAHAASMSHLHLLHKVSHFFCRIAAQPWTAFSS